MIIDPIVVLKRRDERLEALVPPLPIGQQRVGYREYDRAREPQVEARAEEQEQRDRTKGDDR